MRRGGIAQVAARQLGHPLEFVQQRGLALTANAVPVQQAVDVRRLHRAEGGAKQLAGRFAIGELAMCDEASRAMGRFHGKGAIAVRIP